MAMRRGALRAFHHQVGYATRRLLQSCPVMSKKLLPTVRTLQVKVKELSPVAAENGCEVKWPTWSGSVDCEARSTVTKRRLQQHDTGTTCATEDDVQTISATESWVDGSVLLDNLSNSSRSHRRHSRRPRTGRRSKSRLHQLEFTQQTQLVSRESAFASDSVGQQQLSALLECLEEDLHLDSFGDDHRSLHGATEDAPLARQDEDEAALRADGDAERDMASAMQLPTDVDTLPEVFSVTVIKPRGVTLGVSLQQQNSGLLVEQVLPDGVVALWNSQCRSERQVVARDRIVSVNGSTDSHQCWLIAPELVASLSNFTGDLLRKKLLFRLSPPQFWISLVACSRSSCQMYI